MKLEDLFPETPVFTLNGKQYELRLPTLEDRAHWAKEYGSSEALSKIFTELNWFAICKLCFRLLKDKADFMPREEEETSDLGEVRKVLVMSPMRLYRQLQTNADGLAVIKAITMALTLSEPEIKPYLKSEFEKKSEELGLNSTGDSSANSLPQNTDTPSTSLEPSPTVNSPS